MNRPVIPFLSIFLIVASACSTPAAPPTATFRSVEASATPTLIVAVGTPTPAAMATTTRTTTPAPSNYGVPDAIEFETLPTKMVDGISTAVHDTTRFGSRQLSNDKYLFGDGSKEGIGITFDLPISTTARYALDLYLTRSTDFGMAQFTLDGKKYGAPIDLYARQPAPTGRIPMGGFDLAAGTHELGFRVVGKNPASTKYSLGLDCLTLTPSSTIALAATPVPTPTVTPPAPNPAYPLMTVPVQAIRMMDDDGRRVTPINPDQVKQWIDKANEIWACAGIRFLYDPDVDFASVKSTLVNSMMAEDDPNANQNRRAADEIAARYPGKMVILFRWGSGSRPYTGEFSWYTYNFVVGGDFNDAIICGYQNIGLMAHEFGHYLGLRHTFPESFDSLQEAEAYMRAHGNKPSAFDGDGLSDTPPDPHIRSEDITCKPVDSITVNGFVFPLPRTNIMSYYEVRTGLSPQQIEIARRVLAVRQQNGMAIPPNFRLP